MKSKKYCFRYEGFWQDLNRLISFQKLKLNFIDTDQKIEEELGMSIVKIFEKKGENF